MPVIKRSANAPSAVLLLASLLADGSQAGIPDRVLNVRVTSAAGSAAFSLTASQAKWILDGATDEFRWQLDRPIQLTDPQSGQPLAQLSRCELYYRGDPCLSVSFSVVARDQPVALEIDTGLLTFAPLECPRGYLNAALTLRDHHGDGATVSGATGPDADRVVWGTYNDTPPELATFAAVVDELTVPPGQRVESICENAPPEGFTSFADTVLNMQLRIALQLSAEDCVAGTALYEIEPDSIRPADMNCDSVVDFSDVDGFLQILENEPGYRELYPACCGVIAGDINRDDVVDFNDIDLFVDCLMKGGCP